jgi:preprotein translocase subunit SecE
MAVAEASRDEKLEKAEKKESPAPSGGGGPDWLTWLPRKWAELRLFFVEVRAELKKVTWPPFPEVQATTVVVVLTTIVFGFYLYGMDLGLSWVLSFILKK